MAMDTMNYQWALQNITTTIEQNRNAVRVKVAGLEQQAKAQGVDWGWFIVNILQPWNAWDQKVADLADITIPLEIKRVQQGGTPGDDVNAFLPPPPPAFPAFPPAGYVPPAPSAGVPLPVSPYTPLLPQWGSPGKETPAGSTINYSNLNQLYQQAQAAGDVTTANQIAAQINAITTAGPVAGGFVPVTGVDSQGNAVTPGAGIVYTPTGIVTVPGLTNPGIGGALPPAPTGVLPNSPPSINVGSKPPVVSTSQAPATGGTNTSGGSITLGAVDTSKAPKAGTPNANSAQDFLPPLGVVGGVVIPGWVGLVVLGAVLWYATRRS